MHRTKNKEYVHPVKKEAPARVVQRAALTTGEGEKKGSTFGVWRDRRSRAMHANGATKKVLKAINPSGREEKKERLYHNACSVVCFTVIAFFCLRREGMGLPLHTKREQSILFFA